MKKISILTLGSRGDVEPFIALAKGLEKIGYDVQLVTHLDFITLANQHHVKISPIRLSAKYFVSQTMHPPKTNFFSFVRTARGIIEPLLESVLPDMWLAAKDSDVIISSGTALWGVDIAEALGVPHILAALQPLFPTSDFPQVLMPGWFNLRLLNKASFSLIGSIYWQIVSRSVNSWRSQHLGLLGKTEPFSESKLWAEQLHILGYSPLIIPQPKEWGSNAHTTGYWRIEAPSDFSPSGHLTDFLSSPEQPIFVGFGSMVNKSDTLSTVIEALRTTTQKSLISFSPASLRGFQLPDNVLNIESTPHSWLFPQMKAAIHHGGAGTTASAMIAGIPSLAVPFFSEQPFWGEKIATLGVGAQPISKKELSVDGLVEAIRNLVSNKQMQMNAAELGHELRQEDGVQKASALIHRYVVS